MRLLRGLPTLEVRLSGEPAGQRIRIHLRDRVAWGLIPKHRLAQGVLIVPPAMNEYLPGRSRRALRTNISRAVRAGITVEFLPTAAVRCAALEKYGGARPGPLELEWASRAADEGRVWLAASDCESRPVGLMIATVDVEWAMLELGVAREQAARWLLHNRLLERLSSSGVRYMLTHPYHALNLPYGARYQQRLLGYHVFNVSLGGAQPCRRDTETSEPLLAAGSTADA